MSHQPIGLVLRRALVPHANERWVLVSDPRRPSRHRDDGRPAFTVEVTEGDEGTVLWARGELDITVAAVMDRGLRVMPARPGQFLLVDASQLGFLDIGGLRVRGAAGIVLRVFEVMQVTVLLSGQPDPPVVPRQAAG